MRERDFPIRDYPPLQERARAWQDGTLPEPPPARPAATTMLVREGEAGPEVFMLRRIPTMQFQPSAMVFPGGGVDPRDADDVPWAGEPAHFWAARLGCRSDEEARMLLVAAIREVFEECGVLFASREGQSELVDPTVQPWPAIRAGLEARELSLAAVLREHGLVLRTDLLRVQAHWITPVIETRQYSARILVAPMPEGRVADGHTSEAEHAEWVRAADVLAAAERRDVSLMPPTQAVLEDLARFDSAAAFVDHEPVVRAIRPEPVLVHGEVVLRAVW